MSKLFAIILSLNLIFFPIQKAQAGLIPGMEQITGIAVAAVGVGLTAACPLKAPSLLMYIAGAAMFLMSEMKGGKAQKKQNEDQDAELKKMSEGNNMGGEVQLAALEAQRKDKQEQLKIANSRSKFAGMASMMMFGAAAIALGEMIPIPLITPCNPATATALGKTASIAVVAGYTFLAGGGIMGGLMGALAGMVVANGALTSAFSTPMGRAAGMAVSGGLVMATKSSVDKEISKLEKELADLDALIAQFHKETDGTGPNTEDTTSGATSGVLAGTTSGSSGGVTSGATAGGGSGLTMLPDGQNTGGTTTCLNSNAEFTSDCSNPMKLTSPNLAMFGDQPELQQVASQGTQVANDLVSGNTQRAEIGAANLSSAAAKMQDALKKSLAKTNAKLKASGKPAINFEKEKQDILNSMQSSFDKSIAGNQPALAFVKGGSSSLGEMSKDKSGQNINAASTTAAVAVPTSNGAAQDAVDPNAMAAVPSTEEKAPGESATTALGKNLDEYESTESDISKDSGESLWKQVSNRYLLNYDRFFEKKKLPTQ